MRREAEPVAFMLYVGHPLQPVAVSGARYKKKWEYTVFGGYTISNHI